jgi:hypothetical protein
MRLRSTLEVFGLCVVQDVHNVWFAIRLQLLHEELCVSCFDIP